MTSSWAFLTFSFALGSLLASAGDIAVAPRTLPLSFEVNEGEANRSFNFMARARGYNVLLSPTVAVLDGGLQMRIVGGNPAARPTPLDPAPGKANYFLGNDPRLWRTGVRRYAKVRYQDVYPGIDLVYYGNRGRLEYDFVVAPGADPNVIRLKFEGAGSVAADRGDLVLKTRASEIRMHQPHVYQMTGAAEQAVEGRFRLSRGRVSFQIADYDRSKTLVIDPVLSYSSFLGGSSLELGNAIAVDSSGNAYVAGQTSSTNFPSTTGALRITSGGGQDAFVAKFNSSGALVYATYLGGSFTDNAYGIAVDSAGNAYVTGQTNSNNFPTTPGALKTTQTGNIAFVAKLNPTGSALVYSTYLGGSSTDRSQAIAVDASGNAYVAGFATSDNFPVTPGAFQTVRKSTDAFVAKLDPGGSGLVYATFLGGTGFLEGAFGIAVDSSGSAYVTGMTDHATSDFPTTTGALRITPPGGGDGFITKLNPAGSALVYSSYLGGRGENRGLAVTVDSAGNAYVTGYTFSEDFPMVGAAQPLCGCRNAVGGSVQRDAFLAKMNPEGSALLYSTFYGGSGPDSAFGIGLDGAGNMYIAGTTNGISPSNFPLVDSLKPTKGLLDDLFVVKLNADGSTVIYSTFFGGDFTDFGAALAVDAAGNAYVTGNTNSSDFPTTDGAAQRTRGGGDDAFAVKIASGAAMPSIGAGGVVNGASFAAGAPVAAGSIVSVFGTSLASSTASASGIPLPFTLGGSSFQASGQGVPLFFVSSQQANIQVPWELSGQAAFSLTAMSGGSASAPATVNLATAAPGIFTTTQSGSGQGAVLIASSGEIAAPAGSIPGRATRPASRGEFLSVFCTGLGPVSNQPSSGSVSPSGPLASTTNAATVTIGGLQVAASFSGLAPGFAGLYQVNFQVPPNAPTGAAVQLSVAIAGATSNIVTIAVQ